MPCSDEPPPGYKYPDESGKQEKALQQARERANFLATLLCDTCRRIQDAERLDLLGATTLEWWKGHKDFDRREGRR